MNILNRFIVIFIFSLMSSVGFAQITVDNIRYELREDGTAKVTSTSKNNGNINIPESVTTSSGKTYTVTSIGDRAFYCRSGLNAITIPNSVVSIGKEACAGCRRLTSLSIPKSVTSIGYKAFQGCSDLISIIVDKDNQTYDSRGNSNAIIETKTDKLILGCVNTTIPNTVKSIGGYAFEGYYNLTSITIPNSVTSIGEYAFCACN